MSKEDYKENYIPSLDVDLRNGDGRLEHKEKLIKACLGQGLEGVCFILV